VVSVDDHWAVSMGAVTERLAHVGMSVEDSLEALATVTGSISAAKVPMLQALEEVSAVEVERTYQLAPPDADVQ
jgi:hypothetical protein